MNARPNFCNDEHLVFLDKLREGGSVNMFGAGTVVASEYNISVRDSNAILAYWMVSFKERHPS